MVLDGSITRLSHGLGLSISANSESKKKLVTAISSHIYFPSSKPLILKPTDNPIFAFINNILKDETMIKNNYQLGGIK